MSANERKWSTGKLVSRPHQTTPPREIDCSGWDAGLPNAVWTTGKLRAVSRPFPAQTPEMVWIDDDQPDCLTADDLLEVTLFVDPNAIAEVVLRLSRQLVEAIDRAIPAAGLVYDTERSRAAPAREALPGMKPTPGRVVIVLRPTRRIVAETAMTLAAIARTINETTTRLGIDLSGVEFHRKAG